MAEIVCRVASRRLGVVRARRRYTATSLECRGLAIGTWVRTCPRIMTARRPGATGSGGAKLSEIDARIADLEAIRTSLRAAVSAGCDDLTTCAGTPCSLPFTDLARAGEVGATG